MTPTTFSGPLEDDSPKAASASWLRVGTVLTALYIVFGILLMGVPGLSRGAIVVSLLSACWVVLGLITRQAKFQISLALPVAFYIGIILSGFMLPSYPFQYVGQVTTIWLGSIAIAMFVANGMSVNIIIWGFVLVFVGNMAAIAIGYDGFSINITGQASGLSDSATLEIDRYTGLAGQANTLAAMVATPLFLMFLRNKGIGLLTFLALAAAGISIAFLTASRAGLLAALLFVATGAVFLIRNQIVRKLVMFLGLAVAVGAVFYSMDPNAIRNIERSTLGEQVIVKRLIDSIDGIEGSAIERQTFIDRAWEPFMDKPLTGHGPNMFAVLVGEGTYAHNSLAELAVNFGLIGITLWFGMYAVAAAGIFRSPYKLPAVSTLAFLLLMDQSYVGYVERSLTLTMCIALAYCGRSLYKRTLRSNTSIQRVEIRSRKQPDSAVIG